MLRSTHPAYPGWLWYWWGEQKYITGYGNAHLVRSTVQNTGLVTFLPLDLTPAGAGDLEPGAQTRDGAFTRIPVGKYFGPVDTSQPPPPIDPPPVDPPPVDPPVEPPVDPPPVVIPTKYKIKTITRTADFPTVVFFGVAVGLPGRLVSPGGREQAFVTGNKPEFGAGGTEAGAGVVAGDYHLFIGADEFVFSVDGQFTKIEFEPTTDTPPVSDAVVCTGYMDVATAARVLAAANAIARAVVGRDVFRVE